MSEHHLPTPRSLSDAEIADFNALHLTAGHWAALAPAPALLHEHVGQGLRYSHSSLHQLRTSFGADTFDPREAEKFWEAYASYTIDNAPKIVKALLGWYLARV